MKTDTILSGYNNAVNSQAKAHKPKPVTRDVDIRRALLATLEEKYNDKQHDLIVEEFGCKSARVDVAVINGFLHAYEIKSDSDSLDRLPSQMDAYQSVFEYVTLVCGRRLLDRARTMIPRWWGLQKAEFKNGSVALRELRAPRLNPSQNLYALAKMLWKTEALVALRNHGHRSVTSKCTADEVWSAVAACIPIAELTTEVRLAIKARGGSGFAKLSTPSDDSCTTESIVQVNHSPDLSWLLSLQYQHLPD
jgi:hypothetical protein